MPKSPSIFLKKHTDYQRAYAVAARGRTSVMGWFGAVRPEAQGACGIRVGLTVPKALGGAVERNRIKRRMRVAVRQVVTPELLATQVDVILHPRRQVLDCDFTELCRDCARALVSATAAAPRGPGPARERKSR